MTKNIPLSVRCSALFAAFYCVMYPTLIMYSSYMILSGFSSSLVAALLSLYGIVSLVAKPVFAIAVDRGHCRIASTVVLLAMAGGTVFFFFSPEKTIVHAVLYVLLVSSLSSVIMEGVDSWVLKLSASNPGLDYARARSGGSFSFAIISLIYGPLLAWAGIKIAPYAILFLIAVLLCVLWTVPDPEAVRNGQEKSRTGSSFLGTAKLILGPEFIWFMLFNALGSAVLELTDNYTGVLILEKGGTTAFTGAYDFSKAILEFGVMAFYGVIASKFGHRFLLSLGMIGLFIKGASAALAPTPLLVVFTCVTQLIAFPLYISARFEIIKEMVPKENIGMAVSLAAMVAALFQTVISNPLMAFLIPKIGTSNAMIAVSLFGAVGGVGFLLSNRKKKDKGRIQQ